MLKKVIDHIGSKGDPCAKIFIAKWDVKDVFWMMVLWEGYEMNFCNHFHKSGWVGTILVVPDYLQIGWV